MATKRSKRIVVEKLLPDIGFLVKNRALKYQYPNLNPKLIDTEKKEVLCVGCRGQLAIEMLEGDGSRNQMKMKIEEIKADKELTDEGIYQEPLSWNEFRQWVLDNPEVMNEWYDYNHGGEHQRYQTRPEDDTVEWQGELE